MRAIRTCHRPYFDPVQYRLRPLADDYGDSRMSNELLVEEKQLYELYSILADATEAASTGDPNTVSSKAAEAKDKVVKIREDSQPAEVSR